MSEILARGRHFGHCGQNLDSKDRCMAKFYATPGERDIRREFDKILKARFEAEFKQRLLRRVGR
ncbi:hypothetical protein [uncultured Campylobacter sp.]|uniref:hypothetical protein n=1 Tax=uncultured Campylobacter sp. TaxID=218934 RepID=UPI0026191DC1|nr:hypothetical protein [uncultured Campylobacter sp.]